MRSSLGALAARLGELHNRGTSVTAALSPLDALEAESIHIFREAAAQFRRPVLLYSIGKDSTVLLHLARKAGFAVKPSPDVRGVMLLERGVEAAEPATPCGAAAAHLAAA